MNLLVSSLDTKNRLGHDGGTTHTQVLSTTNRAPSSLRASIPDKFAGGLLFRVE